MPDRTRSDAHPCTQCRAAFPSRRSLRRHESLDHRAAPDGARLTALLVDHAQAEPGARDDPGAARTAQERSAGGARATTGWPATVTLVAVVVLAVVLLVLGPVVALTLSVLVWTCWARGRVTGPRPQDTPRRLPRRPTSPDPHHP